MGAARKLQQEIDRTMKKVLEGLDSFDEIWDKVRGRSERSRTEPVAAQPIVSFHLLPRCNLVIRVIAPRTWFTSRPVRHAGPVRIAVPWCLRPSATCRSMTETTFIRKKSWKGTSRRRSRSCNGTGTR